MKRVYLAAPFFNDEQRDTIIRVEAMFRERNISFFSPRLECLCPPDANPAQRHKSFQANCNGIKKAEFVLARIDDFDPGTMWEMGYAYGKGIKTFAFTTVTDRGLNLMLAESGVQIIQGWENLASFLGGNKEAAKTWTKEIV